ncbi:heat shock protein 9/12-domain-containing protein [Lineolata rhizophorae]|uniref:Heat shock protein 9/12-domain-containing protein n=1 Tax=Lineolata rhizophorae TaxID=578093 RepID=A0A6A6P5H0_9PEZI|nr:heat shock protein 9/12-domain-containing protein [Lineolata rhizophorae]
MSDDARKGFTTQAKEHLQPDSTKSTQEKTKETATDAADKAARGAQPDDQKSTQQSIGDKVGRSKDEHKHGGSGASVVDKTKHALGMDKK